MFTESCISVNHEHKNLSKKLDDAVEEVLEAVGKDKLKQCLLIYRGQRKRMTLPAH
jgi:hypothetical protein